MCFFKNNLFVFFFNHKSKKAAKIRILIYRKKCLIQFKMHPRLQIILAFLNQVFKHSFIFILGSPSDFWNLIFLNSVGNFLVKGKVSVNLKWNSSGKNLFNE